MASIYKSSKSKYWLAAFRDNNGVLIRRSTKIERNPPDPDPTVRANLAAEARRKALKTADTYERLARGEIVREATIRDTVSTLLRRAGVNEVKRLSAKVFFDDWLETSEVVGKSTSTMNRYRQVAREFLEHLGERSSHPIEEVSPRDVQNFINALTKKGLASKSIANSLKILRIPFADACRLGSLSINPAAAVKAPEVVSVERGTFTKVEIRSLLQECDNFDHGDQWKTTIYLGYYTAMRLGDATSLLWESVDLHRKAIVFIPGKTKRLGRRVEIPIHPELAEYLESLEAPDDPKTLLTPDLITEVGKRSKLSKQFSKLRRKAGIENPMLSTSKGGRKVSTKSFHALRHSLSSHLAAVGVSQEIRMRITGHTDEKTHSGYTHFDFEKLREELKKI